MPDAPTIRLERLQLLTSAPGARLEDRTYGDRFLTAGRRNAVIACALLALTQASASQWQAIDEIAAAAEGFVAEYMGIDDDDTAVRAGHLDPRTQLPRCDLPLDAALQGGGKIQRRMMVRVACNGDRPWKMYVPVEVIVTESVVVAARTLAKGHVLTAADLETAERDVAGLTRGYTTRSADVIGRRLKQQLIEGRVLAPTMMKADIVVRRGQSVTITVRGKSLNINMEGKALMDGAINQRIRVENVASRRVVEGIVRSPEHVEVLIFEDSIGR